MFHVIYTIILSFSFGKSYNSTKLGHWTIYADLFWKMKRRGPYFSNKKWEIDKIKVMNFKFCKNILKTSFLNQFLLVPSIFCSVCVSFDRIIVFGEWLQRYRRSSYRRTLVISFDLHTKWLRMSCLAWEVKIQDTIVYLE